MVKEVLQPYREKIDELDAEIAELLGRRFHIVRQVARLKGEQDIAVVQPERVEEVKERCVQLGDKYGLSPDFMRRLYTVIIDYAHSFETGVIENEVVGKP